MTEPKDYLKILSLERRLHDCRVKLGAVQSQAEIDETRLLEHIIDLQERLEQALAMNEYYMQRLRKEKVNS
jgi:hypothetical protein